MGRDTEKKKGKKIVGEYGPCRREYSAKSSPKMSVERSESFRRKRKGRASEAWGKEEIDGGDRVLSQLYFAEKKIVKVRTGISNSSD